MQESRTNTVALATVAVVGPRRGPSERVLSALSRLEANVCLVQTMRQLRALCREREPDLVVMEVAELTAERLNAEIDLMRGAGIHARIFVVSNGILPGDRPVLVTDVVDFATAEATSTEIVARITRVLYSNRRSPDPGSFTVPPGRTIEGVRLDWRAKQASFGDRTVKLTSSEQRLLEAFLDNPGRLLSTGTLLRAVWGENQRRSDNLVAVYIFSLREKLHRLGGGFVIENEVGSGYRLISSSATPKPRKSNGPRTNSARRSA